jgi:hypothetical protein
VVTLAGGVAIEDLTLSSFNTSDAAKKLTAMASYAFTKPGKGIVFGEYANQLEAQNDGYSIGGQYEVLTDTNLFARLDGFKKSGDDYAQNILGVEYNWGKNVKIALDYQHETKNSADKSKIIAIHSRVKW